MNIDLLNIFSNIPGSYIWGASFVAVYAFSRFRDGSQSSIGTTWPRYVFFLLAYLICALALFAVIIIAIPLIPPDVQKLLLLPGGESPPLISALILTVFLQRMPFLKDIDLRLRNRFQRLASLSPMTFALSTELMSDKMTLTESSRKELQQWLLVEGFSEEDIPNDFPQKSTPHDDWLRACWFWLNLGKWKQPRSPFYHFFKQSESFYRKLEQQYEATIPKAQNCFILSREVETDSEIKHALQACERHYKEELRNFLERLADYVSRGITSSCMSYRDRTIALNVFGISKRIHAGLSVHHFVQIFLILTGILTTAFVISSIFQPPFTNSAKPPPAFVPLIIMIAANYVLAIACGVLFKDVMDKYGADKAGRPWASYVVAAIMAAIGGLMISLIHNLPDLLYNGSSWSEVLAKWPWLAMPTATAFGVAYMLGNHTGDGNGRRLRVIEAGLQSFITALAAAFVYAAFVYYKFSDPPPWYFIIPLAAIVGGAIGFYVPTWYRGIPHEMTQEKGARNETPEDAEVSV